MRRGAQLGATLAVALFWLGTVVAAAQVPGYSARLDVVSELAARDSPAAALGVASLLSLAVAHAATATVVAERSRALAVVLLSAAAATVVVAAFRISGWAPDDAIDRVHVGGVVAYELLLVVTMLLLAAGGVRRSGPPRWLAAASGVAAVLSVGLLLRWTGSDPGLWQRCWLATNLGWLLLVTWTPPRQDTGDSGWTATSPAR